MAEIGDLETFDSLVEELQLGSARGGKRRAEAPVSVTAVRPLAEADLPALQAPAPVGSSPSIPEIRHQHHQIAGLIARGVPNAEISAITGYSPSFISVLRNAPDMKELVSYYAEMAEERTIDGLARLRALGLASVEELQSRLNSEPEKFTLGQLTDLVEVGLLKPEAIRAASKGAKGGGGGAGVQINLNFKAPESGGSAGPQIIEATAQLGGSEE